MGGKKAGGGFMGIGGESGFLNTGLLSSGPKKIKGFDISPQALQYERDMLARQNAIATGEAPSISQMQFNANMDQANQQALALAASQRGASNPMLAFRQAQVGNQQASLEAAQQAAILAEQERRQAEQMIAATVAGQRGVAFNQAQANMSATQNNQQMQANFLASLGNSASSAAAGGKK